MDNLQLLKSLLPKGRAWKARAGSTLSNFLSCFSNEIARFNTRYTRLLIEIHVSKMEKGLGELLPEWEEEYGIVTDLGLPFETRTAQVLSKINMVGGQSVPYFLSICEKMGYHANSSVDPHIRITDNDIRPFRAGISRAGDPVYSTETSAAAPFVFYARGTNVEADTALQRMLSYITIPAHTRLYFVNE